MNKRILLDALIFTSGKEGISRNEVIEKLEISEEEFETLIEEIKNDLEQNENISYFLKKFGSKYKYVTKLEVSEILFDNNEIKKRNPLNSSLIETLAIIAYNSPCTRSKIHEIRKIDPSAQIEKLIELGLVKELGRSDARGNPFIYDVTDNFYDIFGLESLNDLPEVKEFTPGDIDDIDFFDSNRDE